MHLVFCSQHDSIALTAAGETQGSKKPSMKFIVDYKV